MGGPSLTQEGTILGTFQYMAPEQLEGREADARTDIFAFGTVLYEMATGKKAFSGTSQASLISSIMTSDPPAISTIQPMTPPALGRVVRTCLAKDPEDRWQSAGDVGKQLNWITEASQTGLSLPARARTRKPGRLAWGLAGLSLLAALLGFAAAIRFADRLRTASRPVRASILPPEMWSFAPAGSVAISPDGRTLAFVAESRERKAFLWIRKLDTLTARMLSDTDGASYPFWSPDSRFIGFFASGKLKKIEVSGGPSQTICDAPIGRGGSWNPDGVILFAPRNRSVIHRVPASGGSPTPLTRFEAQEGSHRWPYFLPDGRHFLFMVLGGARPRAQIVVGSLDSQERKALLEPDSNVVYVAPGYLLFLREANLLAQPFEASRLQLGGEPFLVSDRVSYTGAVVYGDFSASREGVVVYKNGTLLPSRLLWRDRQGREIGSVSEPAYYRSIRLSPDGRRISVVLLDPKTQDGDIWLLGSEGTSADRFTFQPGPYNGQAWSPDGRRIAFSHLGSLGVKSSSGEGAEEKLLESSSIKQVTDWSPDGRSILYADLSGENGDDLVTLSPSGDRKPKPFLATPFNEFAGRFSFDGKWIAYASDESGRSEVYVRPFPGPGSAVRVSTGGGGSPRWRRDGKEIYYIAADEKLMAAKVQAGSEFRVENVQPLFEARALNDPILSESEYDVAPDGGRFLINTPIVERAVSSATLLVNWTAGH